MMGLSGTFSDRSVLMVILRPFGGTTMCSNCMLNLELDALRQRKLPTPVDSVGLAAHVCLPGIRARLAAAPGILLSAECTTDLGTRGTEVHVGDAAVATDRRQEGFGALQAVREDRGGQTVCRGVLLGERLLQGIDRNHVQDRPERFGLHDLPFV